MKFRDLHVFREKRFSVGVEETSGRFYLSFPVANRLVDYEEYYEIEPGTAAAAAPGNITELERLVDLSRRRQNDDNLMIQPGSSRGTAV